MRRINLFCSAGLQILAMFVALDLEDLHIIVALFMLTLYEAIWSSNFIEFDEGWNEVLDWLKNLDKY